MVHLINKAWVQTIARYIIKHNEGCLCLATTVKELPKTYDVLKAALTDLRDKEGLFLDLKKFSYHIVTEESWKENPNIFDDIYFNHYLFSHDVHDIFFIDKVTKKGREGIRHFQFVPYSYAEFKCLVLSAVNVCGHNMTENDIDWETVFTEIDYLPIHSDIHKTYSIQPFGRITSMGESDEMLIVYGELWSDINFEKHEPSFSFKFLKPYTPKMKIRINDLFLKSKEVQTYDYSSGTKSND